MVAEFFFVCLFLFAVPYYPDLIHKTLDDLLCSPCSFPLIFLLQFCCCIEHQNIIILPSENINDFTLSLVSYFVWPKQSQHFALHSLTPQKWDLISFSIRNVYHHHRHHHHIWDVGWYRFLNLIYGFMYKATNQSCLFVYIVTCRVWYIGDGTLCIMSDIVEHR